MVLFFLNMLSFIKKENSYIQKFISLIDHFLLPLIYLFKCGTPFLVNNIFYSVRFIISLVKVFNSEVKLHTSDKYMTKCTLV